MSASVEATKRARKLTDALRVHEHLPITRATEELVAIAFDAAIDSAISERALYEKLVEAAESYLGITADHSLRHGRAEALEERRKLVAALASLREREAT